jgi:alpha-galactosidase
MQVKKILFTLIGLFIFVWGNAATPDSLALTPPMGWNSWNCFGKDIDEQKVREIADLMVTNGMKDAGYEYVVIDDCWQVSRNENGEIVAEPERFPSGIKALVDYVHSRGLKFGLYSCAGTRTCAERPGSRGYQFQDARTYAKWGVDFLKYDWCNNEGQNARAAYLTMSDALKATGRPILFSICEWGHNEPWTWGKGVGQMWRTTGDIVSAFEAKLNWGGLGVVEIIDKNEPLWSYAGPGHWNDPDMLQVGNEGLTLEENRTHFTMWCMMAAPLIAGNDLRKVSKEVLAMLADKEVIAVNQDKLGIQGRRYITMGNHEVWVKQLSNGEAAVCFFNRDEKAWKFEYNFSKQEFHFFGVNFNENVYTVRNLWLHKDIGKTSDNFHFEVPAYGVILVKLKPQQQ